MKTMQTTKSGNIKIEINPDRKYDGQFIGHEYYNIDDVKRAFPFISDFSELTRKGFDLGDGANNEEMIRHHVIPFRRSGYFCGM